MSFRTLVAYVMYETTVVEGIYIVRTVSGSIPNGAGTVVLRCFLYFLAAPLASGF